MGNGDGSWRAGRRAWGRLTGWHRDNPSDEHRHPDDGDAALAALDDIGLVRRLLDQAELIAVRTARRHGKSWAEIATRLGVTRQSAWERWRELDESLDEPRRESSSAAATRSVTASAGAAPGDAPLASRRGPVSIERAAANILRRRGTVIVPNVIGRSWTDARERLQELRLVAVGSDPDANPDALSGRGDAVVTDQSPESGAAVPLGSSVTLWVERGGGSGVREPRQPRPAPRVGRAMRDEASTEAVG